MRVGMVETRVSAHRQRTPEPASGAFVGPMIGVRNVCKRFGSAEVLRDVCFEVQPSEKVVIIGPSGWRKSTLLRSLIALEDLDRGEIFSEGLTFVCCY